MMPNILTENQEKLLLFVKLAGEIDGKTKLQKLLFLGKNEFNLDINFDFEKYNYGPYSFGLTADLEVLVQLGLINAQTEYFETDNEFRGRKITYTLSDKGGKIAEEVTAKYSDFIKSAQSVLSKWGDKPLSEIIRYVYDKYLPRKQL